MTLYHILNDLICDYNRDEQQAIKSAEYRINNLYAPQIEELTQALLQAHDMLIDSGMRENSVGMAGIKMVLKKYNP
jgi:hypothetical protein